MESKIMKYLDLIQREFISTEKQVQKIKEFIKIVDYLEIASKNEKIYLKSVLSDERLTAILNSSRTFEEDFKNFEKFYEIKTKKTKSSYDESTSYYSYTCGQTNTRCGSSASYCGLATKCGEVSRSSSSSCGGGTSKRC